MSRDPSDIAEMDRDREEMGMNFRTERDPDAEYERFRDDQREADCKAVSKVLKSMHRDPLRHTIDRLAILIDQARRGR